MKKVFACFLVCLLALPAVALSDDARPYAGTTITVCNFYDYMDPALIEQFEEETGIQVDYVYAQDNERLYTKLSAGSTGFDVIIASDYLIERLVAEDMLATLDYANLPNAAGILDWLKDPVYDAGAAHSVPYMWGTLGILYNSTMVDGEITSWNALFDEQYAGQIFMMESVRDSIAVGLIVSGYDINTRNEDELNAAMDLLAEQKRNGLVGGYMLDETKTKMRDGEAAMAVIYSGDAGYAMVENPDLVYAVPEEGSNVWVDCMCILNTSQNQAAAECFLDFMCRADVAAQNQDYIYYSSPIQAVEDGLDPEDPLYYVLKPSQEILDRCTFFHDLADMNDVLEDIWFEIKMS